MYEKKLLDIVRESLMEFSGRDVTLAFSGGIDSVFLGHMLNEIADVHGVVVGVSGSHDIASAKSAAEIIGIELETVEITEPALMDAVKFILERFPVGPVECMYDAPLYIMSRHMSRGDLITGQGADELFGGYSKYRSEPTLMVPDTVKVLTTTRHREFVISETAGVKLRTPYLSMDMVRFALKLPLDMKITPSHNKHILRKAALLSGMPRELVFRKKKAVQYGSGVRRLMGRMARKQGLSLREYIDSLRGQSSS